MNKKFLVIIFVFLSTVLFTARAGAQDSFFNFKYFERYLDKKEKEYEEPAVIDPSDLRIEYNESEWNTMRKGLERGYQPGEYIIMPKTAREIEEAEKKEKAAPESALTMELPYESGLSIRGVKTIDLKYTYKKYDKDQSKNNRENQSTDFDMDQTLVVNIKGQVGRKITVNVDFDDTKEMDEKRDISVLYKGDPDEVVQEAAFGDIHLSLPATEFVSYNKQVFGLKADLKYKRLRLLAIGSRTKGITETKKFSGNTTLERKDISDSGYIRRRYYKLYLDGSHLPVLRGSERIYLDDKNAANDTPQTEVLSAEPYAVGSSSYTGNFDLLNPGLDYVIDYVSGIITFRRSIPENAVIAVDYTKSNGQRISDDFTPGLLKMIKDELETPGVTREMKNFYSIGRNKILRDNDRGNFIMKIMDLSRSDVSVLNPGSKPVPIYRNNDTTDIVVDFDSGIFYFRNENPFPAEVYSKTPRHYYNIFVEYYYRVRTYMLRPNIVPNSERLLLNSRRLERDMDYYIDYTSGFLTFYNEDILSDTSELEITYEYAPFGGELGQTLVGARSELSLTENLFLGSTLLYNFSPKPTTLPTPQSAPSSIKVMEFDASLRDFKIFDFPLRMNLAAEYAQSRKNPNIFGRAIVESMEGIKQEDSASLNKDSWFISSNVSGGKSNAYKQDFYNEDVRVLEINPNADAEKNDTQQVLVYNYEVDSEVDEASIAYTFSRIGLDFSKKLYLEAIIHGDNSDNQLLITLGGIAEDADGDGILDTEDINGDYTLNEGEDIGWIFNNADGTITRIGAGNGRIDSEDINGDGMLNPDNGTGAVFGDAGNPLIDIDNNSRTRIDWPPNPGVSGWKTFRIPLNITNEADWQAIKNARITIRYQGVPGGSKKGSIKIAKLAVVGNRFEDPVVVNGGTMELSAVNNIDDSGYQSLLMHPDYRMLYEDTAENNREQALEVRYTGFNETSYGDTKIVYTRGFDFTAHRKLNFFLWNDGNPKTVYLQFGSESSYFNVDVDFHSGITPGWHRYSLKLVDINKDKTPDVMVVEGYSNVSVNMVGSPSLKNISQIKLGVKNTHSGGGSGIGMVRYNEIFLNDVEEKIGEAKRLQGDFEYPGWARFGGKYREVDRNFETITSNVTNQDRKDENVYLNFTRLSFMPVNLRASRSETTTPSSVDTGDSALVSSLEEGRVVSQSGAADTTINIRRLPRIGLGYSFTNSESSLMQRQDHSDNYNGSLDYSLGLKFPVVNVLPSNVSGTYSMNKIFIYYRDETYRPNPLTVNQSATSRASFAPISRLTFNPSYSWSQSKESQRFPDDDRVYKYDKTLSQKASASSRIKIFSWLEPNLDYSISVDENNDVFVSTTTALALGTKTVNRNASGRVDWTFVPSRLIGSFKPTQSLSISADYSINDADSYEYVDKDLRIMAFKSDSLYIHKRKLFEYDISTYTVTASSNIPRLRSLIWRDTVNLSAKWKPLEWLPAPAYMKPITDTYANIYFTDSKEHSETTGTQTDTSNRVWPRYNLNINNTEKIFFLERYILNSNVNYAYTKRETVVKNISRSESFTKDTNWGLKTFNILDWYFTLNDSKNYDYDTQRSIMRSSSFTSGWSGQVGFNVGRWRFTPNHAENTNKAYDSNNRLTADRKTNTESLKIRGDLDLPKVIRLPFMATAWVLANRMIVDTQISMSTVKSSLNVESDNTKTYNLMTTIDYEISRNLRMAFSLGGSRFKNTRKTDESYYTVQGSTKLTIQF